MRRAELHGLGGEADVVPHRGRASWGKSLVPRRQGPHGGLDGEDGGTGVSEGKKERKVHWHGRVTGRSGAAQLAPLQSMSSFMSTAARYSVRRRRRTGASRSSRQEKTHRDVEGVKGLERAAVPDRRLGDAGRAREALPA